MKIKIHELASEEFDEAIEWYELQLKGLGKRFKQSVLEQIKKIEKNPTWYLFEAENIHKAYVPKFPFKILYTIENSDTIVIWAIAHMHRRPRYWKPRVN